MTSDLWQVAAVRFALGQCAVVAGLLVCALVDVGRPVALLAVVALTMLWAARLPAAFGVALAAASWCYLTGFAVNRYGELTFSGPDLVRLLLLVACSATAHWRR